MISSFDIGEESRLLVDQAAAAEVAAVGFWYGIGSRDERIDEAGSTHFVEHMLFKGTSSRGAFSIAREVDRLGGSINAFTERECMALHAVVPAEGFEAALAILADLVTDSLFDITEFERERVVIENEITAADDDPEEAAADAFAERIWGSHPLARKIGGEANQVHSLTRENVYSRYKDLFQGIPPLITVAGGLDPEKVRRAVAGAFAGVHTKTPNKGIALRLPPPRPKPIGTVFRPAPYQHVQSFCAFQADGVILPADYYALEVANAAIGESMGSRLFQELRERRGLCYSVFSSPSLMADSSLWIIYATSSLDTTAPLMASLGEELVKVMRDGLDDGEVADAKAHIRGSMKIAAADTEYRMRRLARQALYGASPSSCEEAEARVAAVDAAAANAAMRRFFVHAPTIYGVGMKAAKKKFSQAAVAALDSFVRIGMKVGT